ncbi:hypothetical protein E4U21_003880 [Claviceps maximensis]|nr:hypothetical protein E4U21_003880 [Claviceps maximensis]
MRQEAHALMEVLSQKTNFDNAQGNLTERCHDVELGLLQANASLETKLRRGYQEFVRRADDQGWNPHYETRDQERVVKFHDCLTSRGPPLWIIRNLSPLSTALTLSQSSVALPEYSTERSLPGHSAEDHSFLPKQSPQFPMYANFLVGHDAEVSAHVEAAEQKVKDAIAFARKSTEERRRTLAEKMNMPRDMEGDEGVVGQPAENVLDDQSNNDNHVGGVMIPKPNLSAREFPESQADASIL